MSPKRISRVSLLATGLFLVAGVSLLVIGLRLVASERAVAEQAARARLRAQLREATGLLLTSAARLARAEPSAVVSPEGRFVLPPEPTPLTSLSLPRGRDTEADFYLREAGRAESIDRDLDRAEALYVAAAAKGRDEAARLIALHRLAALARRRDEPEAAARHEADFLALLPDADASTLEALIVRSRADPPDDRLGRDLLLHLGAGDDAVVEGLLRDAGLDGAPAVGKRREGPGTFARILSLGLTDATPETKVETLRILQRAPVDVLGKGRSMLADETWIALLDSEEPGVSWNAMMAINRLASNESWSGKLCRAVVRAIEDILAGRRDPKQLPHYTSALAKPESRNFRTDDLIRLWSAAMGNDKVRNTDSYYLSTAVLYYLSGDLEDDREALAKLAHEGWSRIPQIGRNSWLEHFRSLYACSPELLLEAAGDPSSDVRLTAYEGIWQGWRAHQGVNVGPALTHLEEDLLGEDEDVQQSLLTVLRCYGVPAAAPALRKLRAAHTNSPKRASALRALVKAVGEEALPDVREDFESDEWETARDLLVKLLGVGAVPELLAMAKRGENGSDPVLDEGRLLIPAEVARSYMAQLPARLREGTLITATAPLLTPEARLLLVIDALKSDDSYLNLAGANVAALYHIEAAWPYLIPLLDGHPEVTPQAEAALEAIRSHRELRDSFERYGAGGPSKVLEDATLLTKSDDAVKRRGGALAIGALGDPAGIPVLLGLLEDADESVREAALGALERLGGKPKPVGEK